VLDGLAKTGVQFQTAWATPICSPARAEIMTGRCGFRTGWYHNSLKSGNLAEKNDFGSRRYGLRAGLDSGQVSAWLKACDTRSS
jgi:arylsulfatase A-like enzyme